MKKTVLDFSFIEDEDWRKLIEDWSLYHIEIKKPYKQRGIQSCYSLLRRISGGNIELAYLIVEQSEGNGWQGLFPLKQYGQRNNQTSINKQQYQQDFFDAVARKMGG